MPHKKKKPRFRATKEVRAMARERVGPPPPARVIPDRRRKDTKHKKKLLEEEV